MNRGLVVMSLVLVLALGCQARPSATSVTAATTSPSELTAGAPAPEFSAIAHDGVPVSLAAARGKHVVLYFYPKDETPVCTREACAFRDAWKELAETGVVLIGISNDSVESHRAFADHYKLPFHLVSDRDGAIAKAYGVPQRYRAQNGIEYTGIYARQTFVIGPGGELRKIYRDVDVAQHAREVLADVR